MNPQPLPAIDTLIRDAPLYAAYSLLDLSEPLTTARDAELSSSPRHQDISDNRLPPRPSEEEMRNLKGWWARKIVQAFSGPLDMLCPECSDRSIFRAPGDHPYYPDQHCDAYGYKNFACARNGRHQLYFAFHVDQTPWTIMKVGQWPSVADLATGALQRYRKILDKALYAELARGVGLAAHGVGVGSFVYLRRVFEAQIERAHAQAREAPHWDDATYAGLRIDEKIRELRDYLPTFLVENRAVYLILSKGIHELTEEECLAHFPVVRTSIELILDHVLIEKEKAEKTASARAALADLTGQFAKTDPRG